MKLNNYEPKIISKYDRNAEDMEDKILSLYACGMGQRDIAGQIKSLHDVEISPELVSKISEKIMPEVNAWQDRPLESNYPFYLHGCHPLQGQGGSPLCDQVGLCGSGHHHGRQKGHSGCLD